MPKQDKFTQAKKAMKTMFGGAIDTAGDLMPNLKKSINDNVAYLKGNYQAETEEKKEPDIRRTQYSRITKKFINPILSDYNDSKKTKKSRLKSNEINDAFNFNFENIDFDSTNLKDELGSGNNPSNVDATINKSVNIANGGLDENSRLNLKNLAGISMGILKINNAGFSMISAQMQGVMRFNNKNTLIFYKSMEEKMTSIAHNLDMVGAYLTDLSENNSKVNKSTNKSKKASIREAFGLKGISISEWKEMYNAREEKEEMPSNFSVIFDEILKPEGSKFKANPARYLSKLGIRAALPKSIKNSMKDLDNLIGLMPLLVQGKADKISRNGSSHFGLEFLSDLLKLDNFKIKSKKYNYTKGPISYNGVANRAITQVIPGYLSKILSGINKLAGLESKEYVYNYDTGKFTDRKSAIESFKDKLNEANTVKGKASSDLKNEVISNLKKQGKIKSEKDEEDLDKKISRILNNMGKEGKLFNNIKDAGEITGYTTVKDENGNSKKVSKDQDLFDSILKAYNNKTNRQKMDINAEIGSSFRKYQQTLEELIDNDVFQQVYDYGKTKYKKDKKTTKTIREALSGMNESIDNLDLDEKAQMADGKIKKGIFKAGAKLKGFYQRYRDNDERFSPFENKFKKVYDFFLNADEDQSPFDEEEVKQREQQNKNVFRDIRKVFKDLDTTITESVSNNMSSSMRNMTRENRFKPRKLRNINLNTENISSIFKRNNKEENTQAEAVNTISSRFSRLPDNYKINGVREEKTSLNNTEQATNDITTLQAIQNLGNTNSKVKNLFRQILKNKNNGSSKNLTNRMISLLNSSGNDRSNNIAELVRDLTKEGSTGENVIELTRHYMENLTDKEKMLGTTTNPLIVQVQGGYLDKIRDVDDIDVPKGNTAAGYRAKEEAEEQQQALIDALLKNNEGAAAASGVSVSAEALKNIKGDNDLLGEIGDEIVAEGVTKTGSSLLKKFGSWLGGLGIFSGIKGLFSKAIGGIKSLGSKIGSKISNLFSKSKNLNLFKNAKNPTALSEGAGMGFALGNLKNQNKKSYEELEYVKGITSEYVYQHPNLKKDIEAQLKLNTIGNPDYKEDHSSSYNKNLQILDNCDYYITTATGTPKENITDEMRKAAIGRAASCADINTKLIDENLWIKEISKLSITKKALSNLNTNTPVAGSSALSANNKLLGQEKSNIFNKQGADNKINLNKENINEAKLVPTISDLSRTEPGQVYLREKYDADLENTELLMGVENPNSAKGHEIAFAYHANKYITSSTFKNIFGADGLFDSIHTAGISFKGGLIPCMKNLLGVTNTKSEATLSGTSSSSYASAIGAMSAKYEGSVDNVSIIDGDAGGWSYGKYSFASGTGGLDNFMGVLKQESPDWYNRLSQYDYGTEAFNNEWKAIAAEDSKRFEEIQDLAAYNEWYVPGVEAIRSYLNVDDYSDAVASMIFSSVIQHGLGGLTNLVSTAFPNGTNGMSEEDVINRFYDVRSDYLRQIGWGSIADNRMVEERKDALALVGTKFDRNSSSSASLDGVVGKAITAAKNIINQGYPYIYGGETPEEGGFDCSGLMQYSYKLAGIDIPRTTGEQIAQLTPVEVSGSNGLANAKPGDLLFPHTGHVYMYEGDNKILEAADESLGLRETNVYEKPAYIRRVVASQGINSNAFSNYTKMSGQAQTNYASYGVTTEQFNRMRNTDKNNLMVQVREVMSTVSDNTAKTVEVLGNILDAINEMITSNKRSASSTGDQFAINNEILALYKGY